MRWTRPPARWSSIAFSTQRCVTPETMDSSRTRDEKIIAVPIPKLTRRYEKVHNYTDLPEITVRQVQHFFEHYKDLETSKWVKVLGWGDAQEAQDYILRSIERAKAQKSKG